MALSGAVIGTGAAMEFAYFDPGTRQFTAGMIATPAGALMMLAAARVWRAGHAARRWALSGGIAMAMATIAATALDVMGPPAQLIGVAGAATAFLSTRSQTAGKSGG